MPKKLFVLDVSGFIFRAYFALPPMKNPKGEPTHALYGFIRSVIKLYKDFGPDNIVAVFDGPDNKRQRLEIYEKYKMNRVRDHADLPEQIEKARLFCQFVGLPQAEVSGVEADDTMGSIAKTFKKRGWEIFLATADKDLAQLVEENVFLLNPWKENLIIDRAKVEEIYGVPPELIVDLLAIMGDPSDNIPGIRGFGPKTTVPLLKQYGSLENLLAHAHEISGKKQELLIAGKEDAHLSKRLATIHTDVDFEEKPVDFQKEPPQLDKLIDFYFAQGFNSLVKELKGTLQIVDREESGGEKYVLVDDADSLDALTETLLRSGTICVDVEATHLRPLLARAVGIGFSVAEKEAYYVPLNGKLGRERVISALKPIFENEALYFFGHNIKYDLHVLKNENLTIKNVCFDTILASYLLNSGSRRHSLDHLALQFFGKVKISIKSLIGTGKKEISMSEVPIDQVTTYCCEDADYTYRLYNILKREIEERKLTHLLYDLELPLMHVLMEMERYGIYVNVHHLKIVEEKVTKELHKLQETIFEMAGESFNISSHQQLSRILFEKLQIKPLKKTATGLSTRADVLEELASDYPIAQKILEWRTLDKLRSTYLETLPLEVNQETHRIHPTFNQSVAATGRLSCQDPNLQNIPIRSALGREIREAFLPEKEGWSYLALDYSQMELRLLAHLSQDENLITAFNKGEDIHTYTASIVFNIPLDKVTSEERRRAKAINFGIVYGQQAYGLSQELGISMKEAMAFIEAYFVRYPKVLSYIDDCIETAKKSGKAVTMNAREREIPEITSLSAPLRSAAERLAINTPLQGTAADIIKMAMIQIDSFMKEKKMESFMVLQIHDELVFEAKDCELEALIAKAKEIMEGVVSLKVPLIVDVTVGKNWGEC